MLCSNCGTNNDTKNQFCEKCGKPLLGEQKPATRMNSGPARELLFVQSFRLVITLFGLWLTKTILVSLSFIKEIRIPDLPIAIVDIIALMILGIAFFLLFGFLPKVMPLWSRAYPQAMEVGVIIKAVINLVLLGIVYRIIKPILNAFTVDTTPMLILQLLLLLLALIIVYVASGKISRFIPSWIKRIKETWSEDQEISM